jgi:hypothetical protein
MLQMTAETDILVAYYLRQNFPDFFAFANRMFSRSVGQLCALKGLPSVVTSEYFIKYYKEVQQKDSPVQWMEAIACAFLNYIRVIIKNGTKNYSIDKN